MPGMIVGYARSSTVEQLAGFEAQKRDLEAAGCEKIFAEQVSSVAEREQLKACLAFLRQGDALVVTKPDRLARSTSNLLEIQADLEKRGIGLVIQSMGLDTRNGCNPTAKLTLTVLAAIAEFERSLMLERQKEGIAAARAKGLYKGRPPNKEKHAEVKRLHADGVSPTEIAKRVGMARSVVYTVLAA